MIFVPFGKINFSQSRKRFLERLIDNSTFYIIEKKTFSSLKFSFKTKITFFHFSFFYPIFNETEPTQRNNLCPVFYMIRHMVPIFPFFLTDFILKGTIFLYKRQLNKCECVLWAHFSII